MNLFSTLVHHGFGCKLHIAILVPPQIHSFTDILIHTRLRKILISSRSITDRDQSLLFKHGTLCVSIRKAIIVQKIQNLETLSCSKVLMGFKQMG